MVPRGVRSAAQTTLSTLTRHTVSCEATAGTEQTNQAEYLRATNSAVSWFVVFHTGVQFC